MESGFNKKITFGRNSTRAKFVNQQNEERIIPYENEKHAQEIISQLATEKFLLTQHTTKTKQLHFKKTLQEPETIILGED